MSKKLLYIILISLLYTSCSKDIPTSTHIDDTKDEEEIITEEQRTALHNLLTANGYTITDTTMDSLWITHWKRNYKLPIPKEGSDSLVLTDDINHLPYRTFDFTDSENAIDTVIIYSDSIINLRSFNIRNQLIRTLPSSFAKIKTTNIALINNKIQSLRNQFPISSNSYYRITIDEPLLVKDSITDTLNRWLNKNRLVQWPYNTKKSVTLPAEDSLTLIAILNVNGITIDAHTQLSDFITYIGEDTLYMGDDCHTRLKDDIYFHYDNYFLSIPCSESLFLTDTINSLDQKQFAGIQLIPSTLKLQTVEIQTDSIIIIPHLLIENCGLKSVPSTMSFLRTAYISLEGNELINLPLDIIDMAQPPFITFDNRRLTLRGMINFNTNQLLKESLAPQLISWMEIFKSNYSFWETQKTARLSL